MSNSRAKFESWYSSDLDDDASFIRINGKINGKYHNPYVELAWRGWQAAQPTAERVTLSDAELRIEHKGCQPHGIRDKRGFLLFFPAIVKYYDQASRYMEEIEQQNMLANFLLKSLAAQAEANPICCNGGKQECAEGCLVERDALNSLVASAQNPIMGNSTELESTCACGKQSIGWCMCNSCHKQPGYNYDKTMRALNLAAEFKHGAMHLSAAKFWEVYGEPGTQPVIPKHSQFGNHELQAMIVAEATRDDFDGIAHEIWVAAQLIPGEGITDGVDRIVSILSKRDDVAVDARDVALTQLHAWFTDQRKAISKGCGSTWDMLQCDEQIGVIDAVAAKQSDVTDINVGDMPESGAGIGLAHAVRFAGMVLSAHRNDGYPSDIDGGYLERMALECGMTEERTVTKRCGETCACAEYGAKLAFPTQCMFTTDAGRAAIAASKEPQ